MLGPEDFDELSGPVAKAGVHAKSAVGAVEIFGDGQGYGERQPLSADLGIIHHRDPFAFPVQFECPVKGFRYLNDAVFKSASFPVPCCVNGQQLFYRQVSGLA